MVGWLFSGLKILKDVERWIKGFEETSKIIILLSIEGQVHYLIEVSLLDCMCLYVGFGLLFHSHFVVVVVVVFFFPRIRAAFPSCK